MPSPLFKSFNAAQKAALREFRGTTAGKLVAEVEKLTKGGKASKETTRRIEKHLRDMAGRTGARELYEKTELGQVTGEIEKYVRGGSKHLLLNALLGSLGPVGDLMMGLLRPSGRQLAGIDKELQAAANLLKSFGYEVRQPKRAGRPRPRAGGAAAAQDLLESLGFTVKPPEKTRQRPERPEQLQPKPEVETVKIGGRTRKYDPKDPVFSGEMIEVQSSNVHSIGFIWNDDDPMNGTLQVRFLQSRRGTKSKGPGPLYHYSGVHPNVFDAFRRAASKGEFVWDRLRIRGTVSGHRFRYELKGITGGYVPRQAKRYGQNEYFIRRRVTGTSTRTGQRRTFESALPDRLAGRAEPQAPGYGMPNRGAPNRGTPNRGR